MVRHREMGILHTPVPTTIRRLVLSLLSARISHLLERTPTTYEHPGMHSDALAREDSRYQRRIV